MRRIALLLSLPLLLPAVARADDLGAAVRAGNWPAAARLAAGAADPVVSRLVRYLRALAPGAATSGEILDEMEAEPGWPQAGVLLRRYEAALAAERADTVVQGLCLRRVPATVPALLRCAGVMGAQGEEMARRAWVAGISDAAEEVAFLKRWGPSIGPAVQAARFERMAWNESAAPGGALARQAVRVDPAMRPAAEARLALMRGDAAGPGLFAALPAGAQGDPGLVLDLTRWFRRADRDVEAARVWTERGGAAELAAPAGRRGAFWSERNRLARRLLAAGENEAAFEVAGLVPNADALFLSGWIALRRLARPAVAAEQFSALAAGSKSAITQGRAGYWLGRALDAAGDPEGARAAYRAGAEWATTYYGQLAALAAGDGIATLEERIRTMQDPAWDRADALEFAGTDMARAATVLVAWGQRWRAKGFLTGLEGRESEAGRSIVARFAAALDLPDQAVAMARLAGRDGTMLPVIGWPDAVEIPAGRVERAVALGLIRQESSFDADARSPVGATGLMQLMPATAAAVAKGLGGLPGVLTDPAYNVRLGTAYLATQLERFASLAPALAAYNAGPSRARSWMASIGDPANGVVDPIDWVELIPFDETRNYVQRIVENVLIYRAREGVVLPHPVLAWKGGGF